MRGQDTLHDRRSDLFKDLTRRWRCAVPPRAQEFKRRHKMDPSGNQHAKP